MSERYFISSPLIKQYLNTKEGETAQANQRKNWHEGVHEAIVLQVDAKNTLWYYLQGCQGVHLDVKTMDVKTLEISTPEGKYPLVVCFQVPPTLQGVLAKDGTPGDDLHVEVMYYEPSEDASDGKGKEVESAPSEASGAPSS